MNLPNTQEKQMNLSGNHIIIAGGSGFLGQSLANTLTSLGARITILSRNGPQARSDSRLTTIQWDARTLGPWCKALEGADALVNLVGRTVDCIKTPDHCDEILRSRVESTTILGNALAALAHPPRVWVQMSTAHIYGDPPSAVCDEQSPTGYGLAPFVGKAWEKAFHASCPDSIRGVILRTSFVIGRPNAGGSGALGTLGTLAKLGLGGKVGTGRQGMSWIHEADLNGIIVRGIVDVSMSGVYVTTAPQPVSQVEFMRQVRRRAGGLGSLGIALPATELMVRLGAPRILRTDPELALYGRYCVPKRLIDDGYKFHFATLREAIEDLYGAAKS